MSLIKSLFRRRRKNSFNTSRQDNQILQQINSYEHLKTAERYQQHVVKLLGSDFVVADGMSFYYSFEEIFAREIYRFHCQTTTPRIVDCGANYGTSVAYFKQLYPNSRLIAVEADPAVFKLLQSNTRSLGLKDVELIQGAISDREGIVGFCCEGADSGRIANNEDDASTNQLTQITTVQLDQLIGDTRVDFLKMDIEGAETDVIADSRRLDQIDQLFIEYHGFRNQPQRLTVLLDQLTTAGFRYYIHSQFCSPRPLTEPEDYLGMDLQLNIFCLSSDAIQLKQTG